MDTSSVLEHIDSAIKRKTELMTPSYRKDYSEADRDFHEITNTYCDLIQQFSPPGSHYIEQLQKAAKGITRYGYGTPNWDIIDRLEGILRSLRNAYESGRLIAPMKGSDTPAILRLERVLSRFHQVARQLQNRREKRKTLVINDEYDVQDLLHALLKIDFNDIRPEEGTPSTAGKASRMDFLLKMEKIVVEAKKTRQGRNEKEIGEELIVDIAHYKAHPNCKTLVCFIYDPGQFIGNTEGVKNDLEQMSTPDLAVVVYIGQN